MKALPKQQVDDAAERMLRYCICKYCHARPSNIDRIRKAFQAKALVWVREQKGGKA